MIAILALGLARVQSFQGRLTLYENYGYLTESYSAQLAPGRQTFQWPDLPSRIDINTILLESLKPGVEVVSQEYRTPTVNRQNVMSQSIGREVQVTDENGNKVKGKLVGFEGSSLFLEQAGKIISLSESRMTVVPLPGNLIVTPTLLVEVNAKTKLAGEFSLNYRTNSLSWSMKYTAKLVSQTSLLLEGWVLIQNYCGKNLVELKTKLVTGYQNTVSNYEPVAYEMQGAMMADDAMEQKAAPQAEVLGSVYIYELKHSISVNTDSRKQFSFLPSTKYQYEQEFKISINAGQWYYSSSTDKQFANHWVKFKNEESILPGGVVRMMKQDHQKEYEFVGEDRMSHTAKGDDIKLQVGQSFQIYGRRVVTDSYREMVNNTLISDRYNVEFTLTNKRSFKSRVKVVIVQNYYSLEVTLDKKRLEMGEGGFEVERELGPGEEVILNWVEYIHY